MTAAGFGSRSAILVSPRSSRDGVGPVEGERVRVTPAVGSAANEAVIRLLADRSAVPRSSIEVESGESSRRKRIGFAMSADDLRGRLPRPSAEQDDAFEGR